MKQLQKNNVQGYTKTAIDSFLLLFPGALSALLIFLVSSNRLLPSDKESTIFLLNFIQLQWLGITIAKYGIDQMILARLQPNNTTQFSAFIKQRIIPLTIAYCIVIGLIKGPTYASALAITIAMEAITIAISTELSISNRIKNSALLTLLGNPLVFILIFIAYNIHQLSINVIFICSVLSSLVRILLAFLFRNKGEKQAIALLSYHVPLQQIGNFIMFRLDQLLIAVSLTGMVFLADTSLKSYYLFLAKFPEVASGVIVSLAPILYRKLGDETNASIGNLLKHKLFIVLSAGIIICQLLISFYIFKQKDITNDWLLFIPFVISSLLILPVNLVTYVLFKEGIISKINLLNLMSCVIGVGFFLLSFLFKSIYIFSLIVPVQLLVYVVLFQVLKLTNKEYKNG
ncbi:hypothetical protein [Ferruginibacter albus]|uniref:hypothetical protein n=1 Tax=Ferruginibacter albus TaxID=2875540 RepID=UPI001CC35D3B|nr:hypothetical protein [Ferruginibacter albus]UAY52242.1 hypothetical protein K9M53_00775 [Ferruginibacter albus]